MIQLLQESFENNTMVSDIGCQPLGRCWPN